MDRNNPYRSPRAEPSTSRTTARMSSDRPVRMRPAGVGTFLSRSTQTASLTLTGLGLLIIVLVSISFVSPQIRQLVTVSSFGIPEHVRDALILLFAVTQMWAGIRSFKVQMPFVGGIAVAVLVVLLFDSRAAPIYAPLSIAAVAILLYARYHDHRIILSDDPNG